MIIIERGDLWEAIIGLALLLILLVLGIAIARLRSLFAIVMLSGLYSLVSAVWFVAADAVDVAFTEAAVGAGISTTLMLGAMLLTSRTAKPEQAFARLAPFVAVLITGAALLYATIDLPAFGDPLSPANTGVGAGFLDRHYPEMGFPNVVTSILASYRGFDTLGEVLVVFTAGLSVALLLGFGERSLAAMMRQDSDRGDQS
ncbi:MAG: DUF4040 domain-containing protein [Pseudomonadota bacterium]